MDLMSNQEADTARQFTAQWIEKVKAKSSSFTTCLLPQDPRQSVLPGQCLARVRRLLPQVGECSAPLPEHHRELSS